MNQFSPHQDLAVRPSYGMPPPTRGFQQIPPPYPDRPQAEKGSDDSIGILEYVRIIRRHRGTVILFAFLGLLAAVLYTMPQTPLYRARTVIEIQNMNNDFLNTRQVNPVSDDNSSNLTDVQTQMKIIQSEKLIDLRHRQAARSHGKLPAIKAGQPFCRPEEASQPACAPRPDADDYRPGTNRLCAAWPFISWARPACWNFFSRRPIPNLPPTFANTLTTRVHRHQHGSALADE